MPEALGCPSIRPAAANAWGSPLQVLLRYSIAIGLLSAGPVSGQEPPALALGPADGAFPIGFTSITSVREIGDGRLLVADQGERRLYVLDWTAGEVEVVGGVGQGPGEYQSIGWIYPLSGEGSLLTEGPLGRWHVLDGASIQRTLAPDWLLPALLGAELGGGGGTGALLGMVTHRGGGPTRDRYGADSLAVLRFEDVRDDGTPSRMDTMAVVPGRGPGSPSTVRRGATPVRIDPLVTETLAVIFPDGWLALAFACPYRVRWRSPTGQWISEDAIEACGPPLNDAQRCAAVRGWDFRREPEPCSSQDFGRYTWPDRSPPFLSQGARGLSAPSVAAAHAAPDGRLLVRRLPTPDRLTQENRYDVVDRRGRISQVLRLPANEAIAGVGRNHLYVISTDQYDLQHLRRYRWPSGGTAR